MVYGGLSAYQKRETKIATNHYIIRLGYKNRVVVNR